ncbi:hypothetical protein DPMN_025990 [Dreissena polymorpha]|uniref:Uncharacterized protein n=1 Tax=Dreissena polymorpha TaxID=45954 RepID=A0A9D4LSK2_DREPO|nr:hypothetical protein DPMN_025990 [Dreissena polymorpha]
MEDSLAQRVVPGDMFKQSKLSSSDSRQMGILWTNKCCIHVPDVFVGRVETLIFKCLYPVSA